MFIAFGFIIYVGSLNQIGNWAKKMYFYWDHHKITKQVVEHDLNLINQIAMNRNKDEYGSKFNQEIEIIHLYSTKISKNEIIFTSVDYDFFTGNGRIRVPCELREFEMLKSHILKNPSKYNLVS